MNTALLNLPCGREDIPMERVVIGKKLNLSCIPLNTVDSHKIDSHVVEIFPAL
jgi:hypothetical protein